MNYYIVIDSGGSKLSYLLVDEQLNLRYSNIIPGLNTLASLNDTDWRPFEGCLKATAEIAGSAKVKAAVIAAPFIRDKLAEKIKSIYPDISAYLLSEGRMGLLAATGQDKGILTTAGTGSGVFFEWDENYDFIGGMGTHLGDEGSGFWIGRKALKKVIAAAYSFEKRTLMSDFAERYFNICFQHENMELISKRVYGSPGQRAFIAGFTPHVFSAANENDGPARVILHKGAKHLAKQTIWLTKYCRERGLISSSCKASVSGGVFSGSLQFYNDFCSIVQKSGCDLEYTFPKYVPVVGGIYYLAGRLSINEKQLKNILCKQFSGFEINLK